eukprot:Gregarina_sp_Poly_1__3276@NODE_1938_length_3041_cov_149_372562_g1249_i0_p1_GENE_NODE_1938_length_3041_cov_149_372562_g1249_i0NODE_1938_length_3041_cov_149_372562_g1249_i0_p1_ORF_typecomplete_len429_score61_32NAD_Gly3P_dh_N/PF01210_23/5_7e46NAD_Gly3P_dh_C/PF07479_14/1_1e42ApbA/PF02558_16/0_021F420_oxidored/PF03807_17/0_6F420_oxidored/PF03807_17/1_2e04_NODE_1938_length_3041_cov_149_372562_g1249_i0981288
MSAQVSIIKCLKDGPLRVAIFGSGNWGSAVAKIVALNAADSYLFATEIKMWVHGGDYFGAERVVDICNQRHENTKYLPGIALPSNLVASDDAIACSQTADLIVFVLPHQFVEALCQKLKGHVKSSARAITLIKGLGINDDGAPVVFSDIISRELGIPCCALSGANVASDVASEHFAEATIGYNDAEEATIFQQLFSRSHFRITAVPDVHGVQVCGAVKNVVAMAAGFCDGLGLGTNAKAAIMRIGIQEMRLFALMFFNGIKEDTFFDSAGFADAVTSSFGGRNVKCAAEFVRRMGPEGEVTWEQIEMDMLGGQKLQGYLTCRDIHHSIKTFDLASHFPLLETTFEIAFEGKPAKTLLEPFSGEKPFQLKTAEECTDSRPPISLRNVIDSIQEKNHS